MLFENFYRYGSLIFGGGQVLIPLIYEEIVAFHHWMTTDEFLSGYAIVQALPGSVFSFSAFVGGISTSEFGTGGQLLGCLISSAAIFLHGVLLIYFLCILFGVT